MEILRSCVGHFVVFLLNAPNAELFGANGELDWNIMQQSEHWIALENLFFCTDPGNVSSVSFSFSKDKDGKETLRKPTSLKISRVTFFFTFFAISVLFN